MSCNKPRAAPLLGEAEEERGAAAAAAAKGSEGPMEGDKEPPVRGHQASPPGGDNPFPFPAWEEGSGDENALVIHSQVEEEEHKCAACGESFPHPLSLLRHQKQQHAGERAFVCPECGRGFTLKHNLIIHQRIHTGEKPFGCGVCGKRFSLKQNLLTHQRVHGGGGEGSPSCPVCGKTFREQRLLLAHRQKGSCGPPAQEKPGAPSPPRMHTRGRPRVPSEEGDVQRPLRVKHQQKPRQNGAAFPCQECGEAFGRRSSLAGHRRTRHQAERPPLQGEEGRRRPKEAPASPGRRLHAGDAPFQCLTCGKNFVQKGNLAAHRRSHLGQEALG
ncbi:zinc finger protein LOC728743 homolog [Zootoca vivipara]|uniref:zinc finger protein LOC728743 homolog n=1 Tax=Zootoca vivipara TaxID=8524 RepID=UPI00293BFAAE|nr:zinc finger protein LOC728743 homolog [Zootoca vivipara]